MLLNLFDDEGLAGVLELPSDEQELRCRQQLAGIAGEHEMPGTSRAQPITREVPADGDCFFHSLISAAGDSLLAHVQGDHTPHAVRREMADRLAAQFVELNRAIGDDARTRALLDETPYLATLPASDTVQSRLTTEQRVLVAQVRTDGSWNNHAGDLFAAIAANVFRLRLEVVTPHCGDRTRLVYGQADEPLVQLLMRGAHYLPIVGWSRVEDLQHIGSELALVEDVDDAGGRHHENQRREEPAHRGK